MAASGPDHIASAPTDSSIASAEERLWELLTTGRITGGASSSADSDDPPDPEPAAPAELTGAIAPAKAAPAELAPPLKAAPAELTGAIAPAKAALPAPVWV